MPRPKKCRRVCAMPKISEFSPAGGDLEYITLTVDEFEAMRLIDKVGLSQEECAEQMQVARTTAQQIYCTAREKIATALVDGRGIRIEGGEYCICDGAPRRERCRNCHKKCNKNMPKGD